MKIWGKGTLKLLVVEKVVVEAVELEEDLEVEEVEETEVVMVEAVEAMDMAAANQEKKMVLILVIHIASMIKRN